MEAAYNFKEMMNKPERLAPGHRMCAGCGGTIAVRGVLRALHEGDRAVVGNATGCLDTDGSVPQGDPSVRVSQEFFYRGDFFRHQDWYIFTEALGGGEIIQYVFDVKRL